MTYENRIFADTKIADVLFDNPNLLLMLEHFGISLPVQNRSIGQLCTQYEISETLFIAFVHLYNGSRSIPELTPKPKDILKIIDFLHSSHQFYSKEIYPEIMEMIAEMSQKNSHQEMKLVRVFFSDYFDEVNVHLDYENKIFHPYVMRLIEKLESKDVELESGYSAAQYRDSHDDIEEKLRDLKSLLIKYLPFHNDRAERRKLLFLLSELEFDLNIHSNIEELLLTPMVFQLEETVKQIAK